MSRIKLNPANRVGEIYSIDDGCFQVESEEPFDDDDYQGIGEEDFECPDKWLEIDDLMRNSQRRRYRG
jgi:hypothetical protein